MPRRLHLMWSAFHSDFTTLSFLSLFRSVPLLSHNISCTCACVSSPRMQHSCWQIYLSISLSPHSSHHLSLFPPSPYCTVAAWTHTYLCLWLIWANFHTINLLVMLIPTFGGSQTKIMPKCMYLSCRRTQQHINMWSTPGGCTMSYSGPTCVLKVCAYSCLHAGCCGSAPFNKLPQSCRPVRPGPPIGRLYTGPCWMVLGMTSKRLKAFFQLAMCVYVCVCVCVWHGIPVVFAWVLHVQKPNQLGCYQLGPIGQDGWMDIFWTW